MLTFYSFFWGFASFLPYPALPIGNTVGLQFSQILTVPLFVIGFQYIKARHLFIWLLMLFLGLASLLITQLTSSTLNVSVGWLGLLARTIFTSAILTTSIFWPKYKKNMLLGIAVAIIVHALVGIYQLISFQHNTLPFDWFYKNPSFGSGSLEGVSAAQFGNRPFGLFPEPSAAAASIGPWLIFFAASSLKYVRIAWSPIDEYLIWAALIGGSLLILSSLTGAVFYIFPCILFLFARKLFRKQSVASLLSTFLMVFAFSCLGIYFISELIQHRLTKFSTLDSGGSWYSRMDSIKIGLGALISNPGTFLWGIGSGQGGRMMGQHSSYVAIFSLFFGSIVENGFIAIVMWAFIFAYSIRAVLRCQDKITGLLFFVVWFLGIAVSTSYAALLPIWVTLAALVSFDKEDPESSQQF